MTRFVPRALAELAHDPLSAASEPSSTPQNSPERPTPEQDDSPILPPDELTPAQRIAIAALVAGRTFSSAAIQAGVDRKTLYAWRQQPAFSRAVIDLSREGLEASATRARNLMLKATRTLGEAMNGHDRFHWAMRVASNKRLWEAGREMPTDLSGDADAGTAGDAGAPSTPK